jgi:uncharacterized protein YgiM (DUF1202 family)
VSEGGLKAIKAIVGGVVLLLVLITVARWYGDYRISSTDNVLEEAAGSAQGEGSAETEPTGETAADAGSTDSGTAAADNQKTVVILIDGLNFREAPKKDGKVIRGLDKGEKLILIEEKAGWYHVKTSKGTEGWITASPSYSEVQ